VNPSGPTWAKSRHHRREWDNEDEEEGEDIDFIVPAELTDVVIAASWEKGFQESRLRLASMGMDPPAQQGGAVAATRTEMGGGGAPPN
jgi:hypothetical protein